MSKLNISTKSKDYIVVLGSATDIQYIDMARIAFAVSLIDMKKTGKLIYLDSDNYDKGPQQFNEYSLKDSIFYKALLSCVYQKNLSDEEFFSNKSYMKFHIDRGLEILWKIWEEEAKEDKNIFLIKIASLI